VTCAISTIFGSCQQGIISVPWGWVEVVTGTVVESLCDLYNIIHGWMSATAWNTQIHIHHYHHACSEKNVQHTHTLIQEYSQHALQCFCHTFLFIIVLCLNFVLCCTSTQTVLNTRILLFIEGMVNFCILSGHFFVYYPGYWKLNLCWLISHRFLSLSLYTTA